MKKIRSIVNISCALVIGVFTFSACEPDADGLGLQFVEGTAAEGVTRSYDVVAYNVNHKDSLRSDASQLPFAELGAFTESRFGMQKAAYVTQLRLADYNPDFGINPVVDSVVLQIKPQYAAVADSLKTTTDENYTFDGQPAKKVVNTYPVLKYGKAKLQGNTKLTLKIHEVNDFLYSTEKKYNSNQTVALGPLLGSKVFNGTVSDVKVTRKSDNAELFLRETGLRIPLDSAFFQNKIIAKKGMPELSDASNFIRYFRGLRISVEEQDGYLFRFNPNEVTMLMYYKHDKVANGTTSREQSVFRFDLGAANTHFSQIAYARPADFVAAMNNINKVSGDPRLYLQGMGGPGAEVRIPEGVIAGLKTVHNNEKAGILSAYLRLYSDVTTWNNTFEKPSSLLVTKKDVKEFLSDMTAFAIGGYSMIKARDLDKNPAYYDIALTQTLKDIVEKEQGSDLTVSIDVGSFRLNSQTGTFLGVEYNDRAYTPNRIVLVGSDPTNEKRVKLNIIYAKKP